MFCMFAINNHAREPCLLKARYTDHKFVVHIISQIHKYSPEWYKAIVVAIIKCWIPMVFIIGVYIQSRVLVIVVAIIIKSPTYSVLCFQGFRVK